jgi:hypothetical protein
MITRSEMEFRAAVSTRYHRRRAAFLERLGQLMSLFILLGGAAAFTGVVTDGTAGRVIGAIIVIIGTAQIVFQVDRNAADQRRWLKDWNAIASEIDQNPDPTPAMLNDWIARRYALESECVNEMTALKNDCYNRACNALGKGGDRFKLRLYHYPLMQILSFPNADYA